MPRAGLSHAGAGGRLDRVDRGDAAALETGQGGGGQLPRRPKPAPEETGNSHLWPRRRSGSFACQRQLFTECREEGLPRAGVALVRGLDGPLQGLGAVLANTLAKEIHLAQCG